MTRADGSRAPGSEHARAVFDGRTGAALPGSLVRAEGYPPVADNAVNDVYDGLGVALRFFGEVFGRRSICDGNGPILCTVHHPGTLNNAVWNGHQLICGDADGVTFRSFTHTVDVVAHELTHALTERLVPGGQMVREGESGALQESLGDVFGMMAKQWALGQDVEASDWLIGEQVLMPHMGQGLRSLRAPGTAWIRDRQPAHMNDFIPDAGPHVNSGIPNRAFYLTASRLRGRSWDVAGRIWYAALPSLSPNATFQDAAQAMVQAAAMLPGDGAAAGIVESAWRTVGVR